MDKANEYLGEFLATINEKFSHSYLGKNIFKKAPDDETINNIIGTVTRRKFDKASCIRFNKKYYYATIHNKIVAFKQGVDALIVKTFDGRLIIVVDSVGYKAINIEDYEYSPEKEANPDNELFIANHRVSPSELGRYRDEHITRWNYNSFSKYVDKELEFIDSKY